MFRITYAALAVCLVVSNFAWSQATVNESLETTTLYVNGATGSDTNPGTQTLPLKTIGEAAKLALANKVAKIGTKVLISPGVYREAIVLSGNPKQSALPITFQAATSGTVFISGAVPYTSWTPYSKNPSIYTAAWPNQWGFCTADGNNAPFEQQIVLRREMILVNGTSMTEVLALTSMLHPGTFYVDEATGVAYVWPPAGTNMATADVEVATNPQLLEITGNGSNINAIVFRGITFEYANSCHSAPAVDVQGSATNILFDTDSFLWNSGQGISFNNPARNITVMNSVSNHNGATGFQTYELKNALWQNNQASYNNWRGAQGAYYSWNTGGAHVFSDHDETMSGFTVTYNQTFGIHWDTDNAGISVTSLLATQNILGPLIEKSEGPLSITNSTLCSSQISIPGYGGVALRDSQAVTLTNNTLYSNNDAQLLLTGVLGGIPISNWETGQVYNLMNSNMILSQNVIEATGSQAVFKDYLGSSDWTAFVTSLTSTGNTWWNASNTASFVVPDPSAGTTLDFEQWQQATGQDGNSTWSAPANNPATLCEATADAPDYWLIVDNGLQTTNAAGVAVFNLTTESLAGLTGTVTLNTDGISSIPGASVTFSPATIPTSGTSVLTFTAGLNTPAGIYNFVVLANSGNITRVVALQVTVPVANLRLSTSSLSFSNQEVGTSSAGQTVTLTNIGSTPVSITSITPSFGFTQANTCGTSLPAGTNCTITVIFAPHSLITYNGSLQIVDSDPTSPQVVTLTGTTVGAPGASLSPTYLSFGSVVFMSSSAQKSVTLTNKGTATLTIGSISFTGTNTADFSQTNNCTGTLAIGANCIINVMMTPTAIGSLSARLSVADDALNTPQSMPLTGKGLAAITVSSKNLSFLTLKAGNTQTKTVTVKNASSASMAISKIAFGGVNAGDFTETNTCGNAVAANSSCTLSVTFSPGASGARSGTLTITDSDPTSPQVVTLSGAGK